MKSPVLALLVFGALLVSGQGNATTTKAPAAPTTIPPSAATTTTLVPTTTPAGKTDAPKAPTTTSPAGKPTDPPQATAASTSVAPPNTGASGAPTATPVDQSPSNSGGKPPAGPSPPSPPATTKAEESSSDTTTYIIVGGAVAGVLVLGLFGYLLCTRRSTDEEDDLEANSVQTAKSGINHPSSAAPPVRVLSPEVVSKSAVSSGKPGVPPTTNEFASSRQMHTATDQAAVDVSPAMANQAYVAAPANNFETEAATGFFTWQNSSRQMATTAPTTSAWPNARQSWTSEGSSASKPSSPSSSISNGGAASNPWGAAAERTNSYASVDHDRPSYGGSSYGSRQSTGSFMSDHDSMFTPQHHNHQPRYSASSMDDSFGAAAKK